MSIEAYIYGGLATIGVMIFLGRMFSNHFAYGYISKYEDHITARLENLGLYVDRLPGSGEARWCMHSLDPDLGIRITRYSFRMLLLIRAANRGRITMADLQAMSDTPKSSLPRLL